MRASAPVLLNLAAVVDRLRELELKQWWLADQLGVDRKTVARWLSGRVKRISPDNLANLAAALSSTPEALTLRDSADAFATREEQAEAARLIADTRLIETLGPQHQWKVLESLIKATLQPHLPLPLLGQLYNQLSIAAWRQSDLARAEGYADKAHAVAVRAKSKSLAVEVALNRATIAAFRGRLAEALALYEDCLVNAAYLADDVTRGKAWSNLGATYLDYGDPVLAIAYQQRAILAFSTLDRPLNLAIAWLGLAEAALEKREVPRARDAAGEAETHAAAAGFKRGLADVSLTLARADLVEAEPARFEDRAVLLTSARSHLDDAFTAYRALGIDEGTQHLAAAQLARLSGDLAAASMAAATAAAGPAREFPVTLARIELERAAIALAKGDVAAHEEALQRARKLYREMNARPRLAALAAFPCA